MRISVLTIMPELFGSFLTGPVLSRAMKNGVLEVEIIDIRDFAAGSFRHIDDSPFGGGPGMVMRCQPVLDALRSCRAGADDLIPNRIQTLPGAEDTVKGGKACPEEKSASDPGDAGDRTRTVILSPAGEPYTQKKAHEYADLEHLILICGHYEGMDARILRHSDEQISIGDYVLTGGEPAAQVIMDSVARLLPGSLREGSTREESFENGLLEYPQYTQPAVFDGEAVPEVLRSGNHERIRKWRLQQSLLLTREKRPDLFAAYPLTEEEKALLDEADHI